MTAAPTFDAIVVGAGHNGLVAANYLALAGLEVAVLEARYIVGGACVTEELIPGARFSSCAFVQGTFRPEIVEELKLGDYGLEMAAPEVQGFALFPDGSHLFLWKDVDRTIRTLVRLREMGVRLAIDDFGTGYSSLNYLRQFPVNALKIDRSFVSDIGSDGAEGKIAAAIVGMAHSLGLEAVAEGVESEAQRAFLQMHGCHQLQGFLIARPAPAREIERFLSRRA